MRGSDLLARALCRTLRARTREPVELFGREPYTGIDPGQAVALGAAIQADQLAGNRAGDDDLLAQSTTLLRLARWASVIVLRRASSLPVRA